jgi:anaerobic magnesium-protoporphyrin IX monomethyl ester cyclase
MAMPILSALSKKMGWEVKYHDTSFYEKRDDAIIEKEKTGAFKPTKGESHQDTIPAAMLVPDFQNILDDFKPDVIAITGMTSDFQYMNTFIHQLNIPKDTVVAFGGTHSLHRSDEVLGTGLIDISCFGQGEDILPEILRRVENGESVEGIPGTTHLDMFGNMVKNPVNPALHADRLWDFEPDYSFYDQRYYSYPFDGKVVNMFWLEVGRGCPFACTYCEAPQLRDLYKGTGKYVISRPMDNIFNTIKSLQEKYEIDVFNITHECFLSQRKDWIREFCERWGREVKKSFLIQTRMETVDVGKLDILRLSNAPQIQIGQGVESGSQRVLTDVCNRRTKTDALVKSYRIMREQGFRTNAYFMMGFPTETREEIFETVDLCRKLKSDIDSVSIFQPYPGLPLTEMCKEKGWITGDEIFPSFTEASIIDQPSVGKDEVTNLRKVFLLYAKLPKKYWPDIKKCEENFDENQELFKKLIDRRWELNGEDTSAEDPLSGERQKVLSSC